MLEIGMHGQELSQLVDTRDRAWLLVLDCLWFVALSELIAIFGHVPHRKSVFYAMTLEIET
jgi:hypothetical protein